MASQEQIKLLEDYKDRALIMSILCSNSSEFFSFIASLVKLPIIISSSVMSLVNSSSDINVDFMRYVNMTLNIFTALLLSLLTHLKIESKMNNFKIMGTKFNKLTHLIENLLINDFNEVDGNRIESIINDYDALCEAVEEPFPHHIKKRICKKFQGKVLPTILSSELCYQSNRATPTTTSFNEV